MSKMKHLLRKLHIGTDNNSNHRHLRRVNSADRQPQPSPPPPPSSPPSVSSSAGSIDHSVTENGNGNFNANEESRNPRNFNFFEEEYQVQLAMALSVSDPDIRSGDDESDQIKAAKQLSLACSPSVPDNERLSEFMSLKYWKSYKKEDTDGNLNVSLRNVYLGVMMPLNNVAWKFTLDWLAELYRKLRNYDVVQYDERVVDGFYDAYAIASNSITQGEMPLLVDLQAVSIFDKVEYEVMLVNRSTDFQLRLMENKVYALSVECRVLGHGLLMNGLIQRIANLVVDRMGGPVGDAEEIMKRWRHRTNQLKASLNTIALPLGCLDVGLSRHRALLFKVLADKINLPCMLVKGSLYTGTDDGAFNLVKFDDGSEYIIDLMGAPGTLIPSEVSSSILVHTAVEEKGFPGSTGCLNNLSLVFDEEIGFGATISDVGVPGICGSKETTLVKKESKQSTEIIVGSGIVDHRLEYNHGKLVKSDFGMFNDLQSPVEEESLAQEEKVKDVSKYVISAAKDPEFAQKLHAVLLESGASPPPDLFSNMSPGILGEKKIEQIHSLGKELMFLDASCSPADSRSKNEITLQCHTLLQSLNNCDNKLEQSFGNSIVPQLQLDAYVHSLLHPEPKNQQIGHIALVADATINDGAPVNSPCCDEYDSQTQGGDEAAGKSIETGNEGCVASCNDHCDSVNLVLGEVCPMLGEFAEWEIPWEDLQIGERIGIGSYGEVYRAEWNDTEVAVKKFLVQDFTTDVLNQFKCEAEMMIRLRHPNVVLFMGAVTRPPNLSILTEYLPRGSLYKLIHRSGTQINEKKRMKMALDVARGMNHLHTSHPTIVHRDLKSPNLLVDKNWGVKVCDFGLSRLKHHTFLSSNSTAGTPEWMAPEVLRNEPSNEKCDVYSFGVILWELATLCVPWSGLNPMQVVGAVGFQNRHLQIPEEVDPAVAQIIRDCWENDPSLRPSFSQLISQLKGLQRLVVQRD